MKRKGWTEERRKKRATDCKATQPWKSATGSKTSEGKAASAQNALKHGMRSAEVLRLLALLAEQNRYLESLYRSGMR